MTRTRAHRAALATAVLLALAACSSSDGDSSAPEPSSSTDTSSARAAAGLPEDPTGEHRTAYLAALAAIDPALVADEEDAIDNGINQCSGLTGADPVNSAIQRFSSSDFQVTEEQAAAINNAVQTHICP